MNPLTFLGSSVYGFFNCLSLAGTVQQIEEDNSDSFSEAAKTNTNYNGLVDELKEISDFVWDYQEQKRLVLIEDCVWKYGEISFLGILSEVYFNEGLENSVREQAACCLNMIIRNKSNRGLRTYVNEETYSSFIRRLAIEELVKRNDRVAILSFLYVAIVDQNEPSVRATAVRALVNIKAYSLSVLQALSKIREKDDDLIRVDASDAYDDLLDQVQVELESKSGLNKLIRNIKI